jgi:hypothetical protein
VISEGFTVNLSDKNISAVENYAIILLQASKEIGSLVGGNVTL